jgi:flagellar motor component MotA
MLLFVGWIILTVALLGGFVYSGGYPQALFVTGEYTPQPPSTHAPGTR